MPAPELLAALLLAPPLWGSAQRLLLLPPALAELHAGLLTRLTFSLVAGQGTGMLAAVEGAATGLAAGPGAVVATAGGGGGVGAVARARHHLKIK